MNFGSIGGTQMLFVVLLWGIPFTLLVWFVRTLTRMAASLRDIAERLATLERAIREQAVGR